MFSVQKLGEKIEALAASRVNADDFGDWFRSESWGFYDAKGNDLSAAIAAVHHVLYAYDGDEIRENELPNELAAAIRPFEAFALSGPMRPPKKRSRATVAKGVLPSSWDDFRRKDHASSMFPLSSKRAQFQTAL